MSIRCRYGIPLPNKALYSLIINNLYAALYYYRCRYTSLYSYRDKNRVFNGFWFVFSLEMNTLSHSYYLGVSYNYKNMLVASTL